MLKFIVLGTLITGMASMALLVAGLNWLHGEMQPVLPMIHPVIAFPIGTAMLLSTCFMGMWIDLQEKEE